MSGSERRCEWCGAIALWWASGKIRTGRGPARPRHASPGNSGRAQERAKNVGNGLGRLAGRIDDLGVSAAADDRDRRWRPACRALAALQREQSIDDCPDRDRRSAAEPSGFAILPASQIPRIKSRHATASRPSVSGGSRPDVNPGNQHPLMVPNPRGLVRMVDQSKGPAEASAAGSSLTNPPDSRTIDARTCSRSRPQERPARGALRPRRVAGRPGYTVPYCYMNGYDRPLET